MATEQAFKAVINDTNPAASGRAFGIEITGSNYNHFLGKRIGDSVDGMFIGEGDRSLSGYKLDALNITAYFVRYYYVYGRNEYNHR
jgi:ribosomal protein S6E (S10)